MFELLENRVVDSALRMIGERFVRESGMKTIASGDRPGLGEVEERA